MDLTKYLLIDDPLERLKITSQEIRQRQDEVRELSVVRKAALVEAYDNQIPPPQIAAAGGFNISRMRQILSEANYVKKHDFRHLQEATRFKKKEEYDGHSRT